jgi:hypothetical protein
VLCAAAHNTYVRTWAGWLYLATVIDCFNKEVIGYAMADHMRTDLICDALDMAARNHTLAEHCIFHSDRGTQFTSSQFADKLQQLGLRQSLGRTGICYDNAMAESFFGVLKNELIYRTVYPTRKKAREDIARYIEHSIIIDVSTLDSATKPPARGQNRVPKPADGSIKQTKTAVRKTRSPSAPVLVALVYVALLAQRRLRPPKPCPRPPCPSSGPDLTCHSGVRFTVDSVELERTVK